MWYDVLIDWLPIIVITGFFLTMTVGIIFASNDMDPREIWGFIKASYRNITNLLLPWILIIAAIKYIIWR